MYGIQLIISQITVTLKKQVLINNLITKVHVPSVLNKSGHIALNKLHSTFKLQHRTINLQLLHLSKLEY